MKPPALLRWLLARMLPPGEREHLLTEMDDLYRQRRAGRSAFRAAFWYARNVPGFPLRLAGRAAGRWWRRSGPQLHAATAGLRMAARVLRRRPGYAAACVLTLGIGVGAVATVFSVADWILLRPVPGVGARDLATVQLEVRSPGSPAFPISGPDVATLRERVTALSELEGSVEVEVNLAPGPDLPPRRTTGAAVTSGYLSLLEVVPARGTLLPRSAGGGDDAAVVVVSRRLWQELWGGSPDVIGTTVRVNDRPFQVVGVTARDFRGAALPGRQDLWFPAAALPVLRPGLDEEDLRSRGATIWSDLVGRLAPGSTPGRVRQEAAHAMDAIRAEHGSHSFAADFVLQAHPGLGLAPRVREPVRRTVTLLAGAAALLLILCLANVANLALTHHVSRAGALAVHGALGAGRARLVRRVLAEHVLLAGGGAAVAVIITVGSHAMLGRVSLSALGASLEGIVLEPRTVWFAAGAALAASLIAGLGPGLAAARRGLLDLLPGHRTGGGRRTRRLQGTLVVTQVALSSVLLVGGGLLLRTVVALDRVPLGFEADRTYRFALDPRLHGYDEQRTIDALTRIQERLTGERGVDAAGFVAPVPVRPAYLTLGLRTQGMPPDARPVIGAQLEATPGFLAAMGPSLVAGRILTARDMALPAPDGERPSTDPGGRVLDERPILLTGALARQLFPDRPEASVVGERLERPYPPGSPPLRVVGILDDVRLTGLRGDPTPLAVLPWGDGIRQGEVIGWVRTRDLHRDLAARIRAVVGEVAPGVPAYGLEPVRARVHRLVAEERIVGHLALVLAGAGLLLAALGLHGILAYAVATRRREIGVRAALGATPGRLVRWMLVRGLGLTVLGLGLGLGGSLIVVRVVESRLFGVAPFDPLTWGLGLTLLLGAALAATSLPTRRALRIPVREALTLE